MPLSPQPSCQRLPSRGRADSVSVGSEIDPCGTPPNVTSTRRQLFLQLLLILSNFDQDTLKQDLLMRAGTSSASPRHAPEAVRGCGS